MGPYISNQVKMYAYHLNFETLSNDFCIRNFFWQNPSGGRPTWNGEHWNCFWKIIIFENFSTWAGCLWELGHQKNLCIFPPPFSFHTWGSAFSILPPFERAFEPSSYFFLSAPSSPWPLEVVHFLSYLHSSAPSSPRLIYFWARLRALDHKR